MSNASVSIIMPCYNAGSFLARTLSSIFSQTYKNFVLYSINDGSTDNTGDILAEYSKIYPNMHLLHHPGKTNKGATASMNLALIQCNTKYLAFIDADDIWYESKLKTQIELLEAMPDVGLVYSNGYAIDEHDKILYTLYNSSHHEINKIGAILLDCYIRTPSMVVVKREMLNLVGLFNEKFAYAKDHDMWIKLSEITKFYFCADTLMGYRIHSGQQSSQRNQWDEGFGVLADACERYPYSSSIRHKRLAVLHYRLGEYATRAGKYITAASHFLMAFLNDPFRALKNIKRTLR